MYLMLFNKLENCVMSCHVCICTQFGDTYRKEFVHEKRDDLWEYVCCVVDQLLVIPIVCLIHCTCTCVCVCVNFVVAEV